MANNEVVIAAEVLEQMLADGNRYSTDKVFVLKGADPEARIVDVRWELGAQGPGSRSVVLVYDRPVPETPLLQSLQAEPDLMKSILAYRWRHPDGSEVMIHPSEIDMVMEPRTGGIVTGDHRYLVGEDGPEQLREIGTDF